MIPENHRITTTQYWIIEKTYHQNGRIHDDRIVFKTLDWRSAADQYDQFESNREREDIRYETVKVSPIE